MRQVLVYCSFVIIVCGICYSDLGTMLLGVSPLWEEGGAAPDEADLPHRRRRDRAMNVGGAGSLATIFTTAPPIVTLISTKEKV